MTAPPASSEHVKACCSAFYGSDWTRLLLGDSMHPGGPALTLHLGGLLGLTTSDRVLDVAAGRGVSARALADRFGCRVVGIDLSSANVEVARLQAASVQVAFQVGDAESLPFGDAEFSTLLCECAFCTFPDKARSMSEMARVLKPGGRLGIADLVRRGELPDALGSLAAWIACVGDALPEVEYLALLERAGFRAGRLEVHDAALGELARQIRSRLLGASIAQRLGKLDLPGVDLDAALELARATEQAIRDALLGYVLITATRA